MGFSSCAIDIGSPKLGNIGWALNSVHTNKSLTGKCLDSLAEQICLDIEQGAILLALDAPLFVPLREDIKLATKGRNGEGRSPWSAGAGAQVLAMNIPIMTYLFQKIFIIKPHAKFVWEKECFVNKPNTIFIAEALISGSVKGETHIDDAIIMANYCSNFTDYGKMPSSILLPEKNVKYLNLVAMSLLAIGAIEDHTLLRSELQIFKPTKDYEKR